MLKKILSILVSGIMAVSLLAGCSGNAATTTVAADATSATAGSTTDAASTTAKADETPVTITVLCAYASEDPFGQYVYQYADAYMAAHPNVTVEITAISSNDIYTKLSAMAASPNDLPTLFYTSMDQAPSLYDLGLTEDLNNWLDADYKAQFANGVVEASSLDNTMAFYPIDVQPSAVIYRTDLFEENGLTVPKTWDEFLNCAKALTGDTNGDGEVDRWGFSMVGSNDSSGQSRFMSYLWSNGCDIISQQADGSWKNDLDQAGFVAPFSLWTDLNNVYHVVPTGITEVDYATAANYFAMGYTGMMLSGSNALGVAYAKNPDLKGKIGSFRIPGSNPGTMLNAEGYALCSKATDEEKAAAIDYLKFFSSNDSTLKFWQTSGKISATLEGQKADYISGADYAGYLETIASGCVPSINFPGLSGLKTILGDGYSVVFSGEKTNEQAVDEMKTKLDTLLEDYN